MSYHDREARDRRLREWRIRWTLLFAGALAGYAFGALKL